MNNFVKIISIVISFAVIPTRQFLNSSSISWLTTTGLEKFESSIPIPHYQDTFDILVEENFYSLTFLTWKEEKKFLPKLFKLTVKWQSFDAEIRSKECDVDPPAINESDWIVPKTVSFLKSDRVLLYWQGGSKIHDAEESQVKFQVIFTETCQSSKYSAIKAPKDSVSGPGIIVVKFENTYDVIFHESTMAPVNYFKWSFDYSGTPLNASPEPLAKSLPEVGKFSHIRSIFPLQHSARADGYIFVGKGIGNRNIYSTSSGWLSAEKIYYSDLAFSNAGGFATLCWKSKLKPGSHEIRCLRNDTPSHALTVRNRAFQHLDEFSIHNEPDGRMLLLSEIFNATNGKALLVVDEAQADGRCRRLGVVQLPGNLDRLELSISDRNRYCFFHVTHVLTFDQAHPPRLNRFTANCIQMQDMLPQDRPVVLCGAIDYGNSEFFS